MWVCVANRATNPFCFYEDVCLGRGTDSCSATDREGGGGRELKRKSGVFSIFDMQATSCSVQQLRKRERRLLASVGGVFQGKERKPGSLNK